MNEHPLATAIAAAVADRDSVQLGAAVTDTVRLRALLPGGPIEEHGRDAVVARFGGWFADMDTVDLVESAGQAVADRLLIHYRLDLAQRDTRWAWTCGRGRSARSYGRPDTGRICPGSTSRCSTARAGSSTTAA